MSQVVLENISIKKPFKKFECSFYLTKIAAFLTNSEVSFFIGTPKEPSMAHEIGLCIVSFTAPQAHPKEIVWFFALVENLYTESFRIIDVFNDVFRDFRFIWVRLGTDPHVNNA